MKSSASTKRSCPSLCYNGDSTGRKPRYKNQPYRPMGDTIKNASSIRAGWGDGHLHLVAARLLENNPGNRIYLTLGQINLAPTNTIRQQWVDRIVQAFLKDETKGAIDLLRTSNILSWLRATYQALHSAMNQVTRPITNRGYRMTRQRLKHLISKALISLLLSKLLTLGPFV